MLISDEHLVHRLPYFLCRHRQASDNHRGTSACEISQISFQIPKKALQKPAPTYNCFMTADFLWRIPDMAPVVGVYMSSSQRQEVANGTNAPTRCNEE